MGSVLTTVDRAHRDKLNMARIYGLETLRHKKDGRPSTCQDLDEVEVRYQLNIYDNVVLGMDPQFF